MKLCCLNFKKDVDSDFDKEGIFVLSAGGKKSGCKAVFYQLVGSFEGCLFSSCCDKVIQRTIWKNSKTTALAI